MNSIPQLLRPLVATVILFVAARPVGALVLQERNSASLGFGINLFQPLGYFGNEFNTGLGFHINGRLPGSKFMRADLGPNLWLIFDTSLQFVNQSLSEKTSSGMTTISWGLGPGVVLGLNRYFQPMAILHAGLFYNRLSLASRNATFHAFNPFASLKTGFFSEVTPTIYTELSITVPFYYLGDRNLYGFDISLAANYHLVPRENVPTPAEKAFLEGRSLYDQKAYEQADVKFSEALTHDALHAASLKYRKKVTAQSIAVKGRAARAANDPWLAVQLLGSALNDLPELADEVRELRSSLAVNIPQLLKDGTTAYDEKRYADSERLMEKVLSIAPENETAKIYLPRARSRRQAIEKLQ